MWSRQSGTRLNRSAVSSIAKFSILVTRPRHQIFKLEEFTSTLQRNPSNLRIAITIAGFLMLICGQSVTWSQSQSQSGLRVGMRSLSQSPIYFCGSVYHLGVPLKEMSQAPGHRWPPHPERSRPYRGCPAEPFPQGWRRIRSASFCNALLSLGAMRDQRPSSNAVRSAVMTGSTSSASHLATCVSVAPVAGLMKSKVLPEAALANFRR